MTALNRGSLLSRGDHAMHAIESVFFCYNPVRLGLYRCSVLCPYQTTVKRRDIDWSLYYYYYYYKRNKRTDCSAKAVQEHCTNTQIA